MTAGDGTFDELAVGWALHALEPEDEGRSRLQAAVAGTELEHRPAVPRVPPAPVPVPRPRPVRTPRRALAVRSPSLSPPPRSQRSPGSASGTSSSAPIAGSWQRPSPNSAR
jgi:hypothetical protein